jgi:exopolyphosphatase/guanosine-5'-triphosphate,3'-diphosphate pyrophosphatase
VRGRQQHGIDAGVVVDLGGGSLQLTELRHGEPQAAVSLPLGAVRATTRFLHHDPPTAAEVRALRRELRDLVSGILPTSADGEMLVGLGGTVRTLARIQCAEERRAKEIHGTRLARASVAAMRERLEALPLRRRRVVRGLKPERADIIVAGAVIVEELMAIGGYERLTVCAHGVRHGVLVEETFGRVTAG